MVAIENQSQAQRPAESARIPKEARRLLHDLAAAWPNVADCRALEVVPLKGAMTNEGYQAGAGALKEREVRKVLVRIYGDGVDLFFDRDDELRTFECMSRHGQGPRLLGRFPNGRIEEFIHARTLSAPDMRDPEISALVATKLREFHNLDMPGPKHVLLWDRLKNWLKTAKNLCPTDQANELRLDCLEDEIASLEKEFSGDYHHWIGFCHNDLQYGNIMMDEETNMLTIIDYEYASFNPVAYDIANHFCEMTADYHSEKPHILDYSKYPDIDEQRRFVKTYLSTSREYKTQLSWFDCPTIPFVLIQLCWSGEEPEAEEVENLLRSVEKYTLASHLVWGLWGIISDRVNDIDFDYQEYARQRFEQYWQKKPAVLTS
ncbi:Choline/ethanolamine kinase [Triticum urartu]|uniref:Choline/ethanolamine kinase n=1 Tax=Triticum urartu TaxID=4572 RepID=M8A1N9_TRIUA|nr:Choline/ethanolamine kinase [Triticum urartu]